MHAPLLGLVFPYEKILDPALCDAQAFTMPKESEANNPGKIRALKCMIELFKKNGVRG